MIPSVRFGEDRLINSKLHNQGLIIKKLLFRYINKAQKIWRNLIQVKYICHLPPTTQVTNNFVMDEENTIYFSSSSISQSMSLLSFLE